MKYLLAPLAGFTDAPFRRLAFEGGADVTYTEMVSAAGLAHGSSATRQLLETMDGEGPVACQLFGAKEEDLAFAAAEVEKLRERFVELNLNAGCPMTKVTREGAGAKLIHEPEKLYRLLKAMVENCTLPVTVKTRIGPYPDKVNVFELIAAAESAGAKGVILHARFTSQMHGGEVHLNWLREAVESTKLPIVGNGSVTDAKTAAAMAETGVTGIMIGRAALAHPDIFSELRDGGAAGGNQREDRRGQWLKKHLEYLLKFREQLAERFPKDHVPSVDGYVSVKLHTHLFRYFNGLPGAAALRARLNKVRTMSELVGMMEIAGGSWEG